jgi:hypothetical protein
MLVSLKLNEMKYVKKYGNWVATSNQENDRQIDIARERTDTKEKSNTPSLYTQTYCKLT